MIPQAVVAMLGCARLGAIHSVVFGGFAAAELAKRIDDCTPKVMISASCGHEPGRIVEYKPLLDGAIETASHKPDHCVIVQREALEASLVVGRDLEWNAALDAATELPPVPVKATDPLYILYTSGLPASRKVWFVTMAVMLSRFIGRCAIFTICGRAMFIGQRLILAGWLAIPISSMRRCFLAAPASYLRANRLARLMLACSGG
jgi:acyl-CoA synthetase (AMP-forming)/AMP-acid ligase II